MKTNIYVIASFGNFNKLPLGGGQTSSRRLLRTINNIGLKAVPIHRHPPTANKSYIRLLQFLFWSIIDPILFLFKLASKSRKNGITISIAYMGSVLVPLEYLASVITRILGFTNIMYLKGGGTSSNYQKSKKWQKYLMRKTLNNYKLVMTEGFENMSFVKSLSNTCTFYLPNFTENGFAPSECPTKPADKWNIFYFGRINETKNIPLGIDAFNLLCQKYDNIYFTIVGGGPDAYCKIVEEKIAESPYCERITRIGRSSHEELKKMMVNQHFMLFPSNEPREGHSNALNEAMSFGLVPVVSSNNFLPSIVGNDNLVINEFSADLYSAKIDEIITSGEFETLSNEMFQRVQENFVQEIVEKKLKDKLNSL